MKYTIHYNKLVDWKRFQKISNDDKTRIRHAIERKIAVDPLIFGKPLRTPFAGLRSLRVGDYRIIYLIKKDSVEIVMFGHRSTIYSDLNSFL